MESRNARAPRAPRIRPALEPLVRELANLPESERRDVVAAAEETAKNRRAALSWDSWEGARSVVHLGGDAVEDCGRLYDGT
jgi:hypothetical protein